MPVRLLPPGWQQDDANGNPVSGAQLYTYEPGTTTPKPTYSDAALTILNTNPVVADSGGVFGPVFAETGQYRLVMETPTAAPLWDADPVDGDSGDSAAPGAGIRNLLINADFSANSFVTTTAVDGAPINSPWYALNQTNNTTAALQTLQQDGIPNNLRLTQANATPQRHGVAQIVPAINSYRARGANVTLSGQIRHSLPAPIRYAVLAWTGTADATTRDVVNDWTSTNYTPSNFFIAANIAVVAVGSITPTAGTWTPITTITGAVSSSATNVVVLFWTESATAQTATLDVAQVQLEVAATATAFEFLPNRLNLLGPPGWALLTSSSVSGTGEVTVNWAENVYQKFAIHIIGWRYASSSANNLFARILRGGTVVSGGSDYTNSNSSWVSGVASAGVAATSIMSLTDGGTNGEPISITLEIDHNEIGQTPQLRAYSRWTTNAAAQAHGLYTSNVSGGSGWLSGVVVGVVGGAPNISGGRITVLGLKAS
jgi:hypothetical protein